MAGGATLGRWAFRPRPPSDGRGDETIAFRARLAAALRAGHGVGASFRISVTSGPEPALWLTPEDSGSTRWAARAFTPAYDRHQWRWIPDLGESSSRVEVWDGRRSRDWPEQFRSATDPVAALDAVAWTLGALPRGARCDWLFRPMPLTYASWWEVDRPVRESSPPRPGSGTAMSAGRATPSDESRERPSFWQVRVRLQCEGTNDPREFGARAARALESATRGVRGNGLRFRRRPWWAGERGFPMAESEVLLALPTPASPATGDGDSSTFGGDAILPLGRTVAGKVIGPPVEPGQGRHLAILGETGMGKSSLLVALSRRLPDSVGLILFDPLGETAEAVRQELTASAASRLLWIESGAAPGLNALEGIGPSSDGTGARQERQLNDLVHSLRRVRSGRYADSGFWGPRLEEMLTRALRAAAALPEGTLVDAHTLLASGGRGFRAVPPEASEAVQELGDRIRSRPEDADGARRLLYEVTRSPILVRMLCARRPSIRAAELVAPGKIVLIAGNAPTVGESTARYVLSVYLALVWAELLARPGGAKTFVVLDEAQWFVHESLAEMLRLGRRRNVHVVLATQGVASLPEVVADAVWTNVADFVAFRGSPDEAREFSRVARGVPPEAILALPRGEAAVLLGKGNSVHWLRTARVPGIRPPKGESSGISLDVPSTEASIPTESPSVESEVTVAPTGEIGVETREVLLAIARRVDRAGGEVPVRVSLVELRREVDPSGRAVRSAGGILGRSGAIVRSGRDESGPCWWIDPGRFAVEEPGALSPAAETRSERPQPS